MKTQIDETEEALDISLLASVVPQWKLEFPWCLLRASSLCVAIRAIRVA